MKIVFVLTYPIYHDLLTAEQWLERRNQDRWIPGLLAQMGHEVELWAVDHMPGEHASQLEGFGDYRIRFFRNDGGDKRTKFHFSDSMVEAAKQMQPDLCMLKGVDGGAGIRLLERYLLPKKIPFATVIGGKYYHRTLAEAQVVLYETEYQRRKLLRPGAFAWRRRIAADRLIRLPKAVDTSLFHPLPGTPKEWDVITVGRLVPRNKKFEDLAMLGESARVAVVGGGPLEASLRKRFPSVSWLGKVPQKQVPALLNRARLFLHAAPADMIPRRDFYPRAITEALACGVPVVAFKDLIQPDVVPSECGMLVERRNFIPPVLRLLQDDDRLQALSDSGRRYAASHLHPHSARPALQEMLARFFS